jgi:hypothetical protein
VVHSRHGFTYLNPYYLENTILIDYRGSIKYETIGELIHKFKLLVPKMGIQIGTYKRVLLIMIESLENMMKHSYTPPENNSDTFDSMLIVKQENNRFIIISENNLRNEVIPVLKSKIDYLNSMDQQGLKNIYKETITNGIFTNTGGAGLGLIEIAKISSNPIKYVFSPINEDFSRYTQEVEIDIK